MEGDCSVVLECVEEASNLDCELVCSFGCWVVGVFVVFSFLVGVVVVSVEECGFVGGDDVECFSWGGVVFEKVERVPDCEDCPKDSVACAQWCMGGDMKWGVGGVRYRVMDTHTTDLCFVGVGTRGVSFCVCLMMCIIDGVDLFSEAGFDDCGLCLFCGVGVVWGSEEVVGWFIVYCGVPFCWCEFVPVVYCCFPDAVADVCGGFLFVLSGVVVGADDPCGVVEDDGGVCYFFACEWVVVVC